MSDKLFGIAGIAIVVIAAIAAVVQIIAIHSVASRCREQGYSVACVTSVCRCVQEVQQ